MSKVEDQIDELQDRVARLESLVSLLLQRLSSLEKKIARRASSSVAFSQALMDDRATQASRLDHAFERIKGLEVSVFPNLLSDIESIYRIVGGDGVSAKPNPLDHRNSDTDKPNST